MVVIGKWQIYFRLNSYENGMKIYNFCDFALLFGDNHTEASNSHKEVNDSDKIQCFCLKWLKCLKIKVFKSVTDKV